MDATVISVCLSIMGCLKMQMDANHVNVILVDLMIISVISYQGNAGKINYHI